MGTNYYLYREIKPACSCCKRPADVEILHIGKSSGGWCFALHIYPEKEINDLKDWKPLFQNLFQKNQIFDEYDNPVSPKEMIDIITKREWKSDRRMTPLDMSRNHALPGPNNLLRSQLMPHHCVKHGEGTWDCIIGDFS